MSILVIPDMCGIASIFGYLAPAAPVDGNELLRISESMASRGPDGSGIWISDDKRIGMAHRRLAIIDLAERSLQPLSSWDTRYQIVFNGEIYNYRQLRTELAREGARFATQSDTEVVIEAYRQYGTDVLKKLRGMFAFALYDRQEQQLLLARDPLGIKPLYYSDDGWTIRAASQVKALVAGGAVPATPEPAGLVGFLLFGSVPEPFTTYAGIRSLPAGSFLTVSRRKPPSIRSYVTLSTAFCEPDDLDVRDAEQAVSEAIRDSVAAHLVSDVPVGMLLSAGIDSSVLLGLITELEGPQHRAHTIVFEDHAGTSLDESETAASIAKLFAQPHAIHRVSNKELAEDLPAIMRAMDQPSIDGINTWFAAKACAADGLRVAISGIGGDELFGGYPSFRSVPRWHALARLPSKLPGMGAWIRSAIEATAGTSRPNWIRGAGLIEYGGTWAGAYLLRRAVFLPHELPSIIGADLAREGLLRLSPTARLATLLNPDPGNGFARVACLETGSYMRNQLLRDTDWASMAHGLEVRTPFVDWRLLQSVATLVKSIGRTDKRALLRALAHPLPAAITNRRKTGFSAPLVHSPWQDSIARQLVVKSGKLAPGRYDRPAKNMAALIWHAQELPSP